MLTNDEFRLFKNLIYEESGIYLSETKKEFLEYRLLKRMNLLGLPSPYWYYRFIIEKKKSELLILLDLLTINETSFFRNRPQFDLFKNIILPDIQKRKGHDITKRLRIWSAGCSTGEEPYSIAMVVHEMMQNRITWDVRIFASDLSLTALETANEGRYASDKINATVDDYYIKKYFEKNGDHYRVNDKIKKMVVFDFHNLKNENGLINLDIIFCRNVMIYFDEGEQKRLIEKFYRSLNQDGYLLIGHAESLQGMNKDFTFIYENKGTAYRKLTREVNGEDIIG